MYLPITISEIKLLKIERNNPGRDEGIRTNSGVELLIFYITKHINKYDTIQ